MLVIFKCEPNQRSKINVKIDREKKKDLERDELWKKLEELKLSNAAVFQNNSHRLLSVQNNNNSNNNNSDARNKSLDVAADATDKSDPAIITAASESTLCAK